MIECRGLTHRYGPLTAIENLSFEVKQGEVLGLLGPNGAGKTTTLRAVVGLLRPSRGQVSIGGHDLAADPLRARRMLGYLPEAVPLYRELTVREFLDFAVRMKGVPRRRAGMEIDRLVEACGLGSVMKRLIGYCSRGFRQRIGLAQALAGDPPVLVLDEPTVGLDPAQVVDIRETIAKLSREKAVMLSTHILPEASLLCTRVLILHRGRCVAEDRPDALTASLRDAPHLRVVCRAPREKARAVLDACGAVVAAALVAEDPGRSAWRVDLRSRDDIAKLVSTLVRAGCDVEEVRPERLALEEVFLSLVREERVGAAP